MIIYEQKFREYREFLQITNLHLKFHLKTILIVQCLILIQILKGALENQKSINIMLLICRIKKLTSHSLQKEKKPHLAWEITLEMLENKMILCLVQRLQKIKI